MTECMDKVPTGPALYNLLLADDVGNVPVGAAIPDLSKKLLPAWSTVALFLKQPLQSDAQSIPNEQPRDFNLLHFLHSGYRKVLT